MAESHIYKGGKYPRAIPSKLICAFEGVAGHGSVDERQGCVLAYYDIMAGGYVDGEDRPPLAEGKQCTKTVVIDLLNEPFIPEVPALTMLNLKVMNKFRHGPEVSESRQFRLEFGGAGKVAADVQKEVINQVCRAGAESYYGSRITCPRGVGPPPPEPAPTPMRAPPPGSGWRPPEPKGASTTSTNTTIKASVAADDATLAPPIVLGAPSDDGQEHLREARKLAAEGRYGPARDALQRAQAQGWNDMDLVDLLGREPPGASADSK